MILPGGHEDEAISREGNILKKGLYYFNHFFEWLNGKYRLTLGWAVSHRKTVIFASVVIFFVSLYLGKFVGSAFFPETDQGQQQSGSFGDIFISLGLAIIFVYIVLAAQFESFIYTPCPSCWHFPWPLWVLFWRS